MIKERECDWLIHLYIGRFVINVFLFFIHIYNSLRIVLCLEHNLNNDYQNYLVYNEYQNLKYFIFVQLLNRKQSHSTVWDSPVSWNQYNKTKFFFLFVATTVIGLSLPKPLMSFIICDFLLYYATALLRIGVRFVRDLIPWLVCC